MKVYVVYQENGFGPDDWKCGSIELTTGQHGDVAYIYEIDLTNKKLTYSKV